MALIDHNNAKHSCSVQDGKYIYLRLTICLQSRSFSTDSSGSEIPSRMMDSDLFSSNFALAGQDYLLRSQ